MTWERPAYQRLNGYASFDRQRILVWCNRCSEVHTHALRGQNGYFIAACNRAGGYPGYVIVEVNRFRTEAAEAEWAQQQFAARGLAAPLNT